MLLSEFNAGPSETAAEQARVWAAIPRWVDAVVAARPYESVAALAATADAQARTWTGADLDVALADHPRIGQKPTGRGSAADASRSEQAAVGTAAEETVAAIATGNAEYEERFGRVFLIRAAGRSAEQILGELRRRLDNDADTETAEAISQLREIALLRLRTTFTDPEE